MGNSKVIMVKDLPKDERPRERMLHKGPDFLTNAELLAILLRTGRKNESVLHLAERILVEVETLQNLLDFSIEELTKIKGVGPAKAIEIKAALELGKRIASQGINGQPYIRTPRDASDLVMEDMRFLKQEHFLILLLNTKNQVIAKETITIGTLNSSLVHPREVFKPAIKKSVSAIIAIHNHPSGDPTPSKEDIEVTKRLIQAGGILGIDVLDHIIIGNNKYFSLKDKGLFG